MKIHILGICGTFMGGLAVIARQQGHQVSGCDATMYPPMSEVLSQAGVTVLEGYRPEHIPADADIVIVGNAISRGNPALEYVLSRGLPYTSGPQWLAETGLSDRHVLAVSGTHGKTTVSSMLAWILEFAGLSPGYLIGGVAKNFGSTSRLGSSHYFVIEADEYDSAFFDKRSKFLHYHPRTLVINNLEFDHADIFADLAAIQKQFAILLRTVAANGVVIRPAVNVALDEVLAQGCWAPVETFGTDEAVQSRWQAHHIAKDGGDFSLRYDGELYLVHWSQCGLHNVNNALAAVAAAYHVGVDIETSVAALKTFAGVKRRMEVYATTNGITIYDDFAHHPTEIKATLAALRARVGNQRIVAILQFASNTMQDGLHNHAIADSLVAADRVLMLQPENKKSNLQPIIDQLDGRAQVHQTVDHIVNDLSSELVPDDHVLIMSNKNFGGIHQQLVRQLKAST